MNPIVQALRQLIEWVPIADDAATQFSTWSSLDDFNRHWQLAEISQSAREIVIVDGWPNRTVDDRIELGRYLTPYDWAAIHTVSCEQPATIVLVELQDVSHPTTDSERFFASASYRRPTMLPNVCVIAPVGGGSACGSIVDLWNHLEQSTTPTQEQRDYVRRCWRSSLIQTEVPDDHHAIANLMGPMALWEDGPWDDHARALRQLFRCLDLFSTATNECPTVDWTAAPLASVLQSFPHPEKPIRLLLLDDMAERQHWATILQRYLGLSTTEASPNASHQIGNVTIELQTCELANRLLELLQPETDLPDVLLLDLRLFQGQGLDAEAKLYEKMIGLAEEYIDVDGRRTPWPGFTPTDIARMKDWLAKPQRGHNADYHRILTLPARLLALRHPLLPIVLFSSASRRPMLEHVKPYGTIYTALAKPHVPNTDGAYLIPDFTEHLTQALATALPIAAGRRVLHDLQQTVQEATQNDPIPVPFFNEPGHYRVELFLDEQGRRVSSLTVSGLLLIFSNPQDIDAFHQRFNDDFNEWSKTAKDDTTKNWFNQCGSATTTKLNDAVTNKQVFAAIVSVCGNFKNAVGTHHTHSDESHDERVADNLNQQLMLSNIELAVYGLARRHIPADSSVTFAVYGATRYEECDPTNAAEHERRLWLNWGLRAEWVGTASRLWTGLDTIEEYLNANTTPSPAMQTITDPLHQAIRARQTYNTNTATQNERKDLSRKIRYTVESSIRPLVQEIMQQHIHSCFRPTVSFARAYTINNGRRLISECGRMLHGLADIATREGDGLDALRQRGWQEDYGWPLWTRIQALRFYLRGQWPEALAELTLFPLRGSRFAVQLTHEILTLTHTMSGRDWLRFCQRRSECVVPTTTPYCLQGTIVVDANQNKRVRIAAEQDWPAAELFVAPELVANIVVDTVVEFQLVRHVIPDHWEAIDVRVV